MADAVTSQTIMDGARHVVMSFTNVSDGSGESAVTKVDVSALESDPMTGAACDGVSIESVTFSTFGMSVKLLWVATTPTICWDLNSDYTTDEDFTGFGGIQNTAASGGNTGDIALTTTGHTAGDSYVIVLTLIKEYS